LPVQLTKRPPNHLKSRLKRLPLLLKLLAKLLVKVVVVVVAVVEEEVVGMVTTAEAKSSREDTLIPKVAVQPVVAPVAQLLTAMAILFGSLAEQSSLVK
jgi:hypothetical protein